MSHTPPQTLEYGYTHVQSLPYKRWGGVASYNSRIENYLDVVESLYKRVKLFFLGAIAHARGTVIISTIDLILKILVSTIYSIIPIITIRGH